MKISKDMIKVSNARNKDRIAKIWHQMHIELKIMQLLSNSYNIIR